jgi:hypothetical protein
MNLSSSTFDLPSPFFPPSNHHLSFPSSLNHLVEWFFAHPYFTLFIPLNDTLSYSRNRFLSRLLLVQQVIGWLPMKQGNNL